KSASDSQSGLSRLNHSPPMRLRQNAEPPLSGPGQGSRPKNRTNLRFPLYEATEGIEQLDEEYLQHVFETVFSREIRLSDTGIRILVIVFVLRSEHMVPNRKNEAIVLVPVFFLDRMMDAMRLRCDQNIF